MSSTPLANRPTAAQSTVADFATYGPVHLDVVDSSRSLAFWRDLVGLTVLDERDGALRLGVEDAELLVLHPGATRRTPRGHTGLYHLAIHLPSEAEFARVLARLFNARYPHAPTDHIMHWATYADDPDGIGLELSFETLDRFGHYELAGRHAAVVDSEGSTRDAVAPLDLEEVFSHLPGDDPARPLPAATRIGHLHFHVAELEPAVRFYEAVGFTFGVDLLIGMAEMHAGGSFPHRLALNVWQGVGAPPPPDGAAGLRHAVLWMRSPDDVSAAVARVRALGADVEELPGGGALVRDPSGNRMHLTAGEPGPDR
jgi:catechol 2,3-dioxygenase